MSKNQVKTCQEEAKGSIRWTDDWWNNFYVCVANCRKMKKHREIHVFHDYMDGLVERDAERQIIQLLCEGCEEVADGEAEGNIFGIQQP